MNDSHQVAKIDNPFSAKAPAVSPNAVATSDSERAIQEVQAALVIAKKFPRDQMKAMDRIMNACTRPTLANGALYSYPRGGQEVTGPSIRLAEAMAQEWGNMQFGIRELSADNGSSTVEAFAWDVETNTKQVKVFQVPHIRYSRSKGNTKLTDPRDIYEVVANQGARRLRACILGIIPGDVTEAAVQQCGVTQASTVDVNPESIKVMVDSFASTYRVTQEAIEKRLGKRVEAINGSQMLNLRKIFQSLKDGMSKPADWFDVGEFEETVGPKSSEINKELGATERVDKPAEELKPAAEVDETLEIAGQEHTPAMTYAELMEVVKNADASTIQDARHKCLQWLAIEGNEVYQDEILASYAHKASQIKAANSQPEVQF